MIEPPFTHTTQSQARDKIGAAVPPGFRVDAVAPPHLLLGLATPPPPHHPIGRAARAIDQQKPPSCRRAPLDNQTVAGIIDGLDVDIGKEIEVAAPARGPARRSTVGVVEHPGPVGVLARRTAHMQRQRVAPIVGGAVTPLGATRPGAPLPAQRQLPGHFHLQRI